jgi:predicted alpha/beta superfamily hydrolase
MNTTTEQKSVEHGLDGLRTHWLLYPSAGWQTGDVAGQLLVSRIKSPQLRNERTVLLHLPAAYGEGDKRYPVVYLQDGQNLFDPATAYCGETWRVGETLAQLAGEGIEAIVVAPYHMEKQRVQEYNPFPGWRRGRGEAYTRFVAETLKPLVDHDFRTLSDAANTVIGGSSMGGLVSLYAYCTRPAVFGRALVMSPSLWVAQGAAYHLGRAKLAPGGKLYIDNGTRESSAQPLAAIALEQGYRAGVDLLYVQGKGERHTESAWARRLPDALRFLLA